MLQNKTEILRTDFCPRFNKNEIISLKNIGFVESSLKNFLDKFKTSKEFVGKRKLLVLNPACCYFDSDIRQKEFERTLPIAEKLFVGLPSAKIFCAFKMVEYMRSEKNDFDEIASSVKKFEDRFFSQTLRVLIQNNIVNDIVLAVPEDEKVRHVFLPYISTIKKLCVPYKVSLITVASPDDITLEIIETYKMLRP